MKIIGIVLAGGKSSRMGTDKGLLPIGKETFASHIGNKLEQSGCSQVIISTNNEAYKSLGYPLIQDRHQEIGPLGGLHACMLAYPAEGYMVVSCDSPYISVSALQKMKALFIQKHHSIIGINEEREHPLIACYAGSVLSVIEKQIEIENYRMKDLIKKVMVDYLSIPSEETFNCNTPSDLKLSVDAQTMLGS
ncbi:molybdenum cofactor guanylyltransferase [Algivirga pacifica]|uniref:Probable molybdenum cofactor guanylyltransferase n=1 Tax=Algivirga pacifica TaxID=1162670 RepID=A0ABP9D910_9BACT